MQMLLLPSLVALLGWFISWGFIKVLFFPRSTKQFFGKHWQSPFAKIAHQISINDLLPLFTKSDSFNALLPFIDNELDVFFKERLVQKMPVISMFIGDKTITQLKEVFLEELEKLFPALISQFSQIAKEEILLNIETKWSKELEIYLLKASQKIRIMAFCLGFIWGLVIQFILSSL